MDRILEPELWGQSTISLILLYYKRLTRQSRKKDIRELALGDRFACIHIPCWDLLCFLGDAKLTFSKYSTQLVHTGDILHSRDYLHFWRKAFARQTTELLTAWQSSMHTTICGSCFGRMSADWNISRLEWETLLAQCCRVNCKTAVWKRDIARLAVWPEQWLKS